MRHAFLSLSVLVVAIALFGCPKPKETPEQPVTPIAKAEKAPAKPPVGEFAWTKTPTVDMIPDKPLHGVVNGKPFEAKTVLVCKDTGGILRQITISNKALESDNDLLMDDTGVDIRLKDKITVGTTFTKAMDEQVEFDEYHSFYHYQQEGDKGVMSVNTPWAAALVVEEGKDAGYDPNGPKVQVTGTFRGKLALCFEDSTFTKELSENSWIAGTFEAKIRYWGAPSDVENVSPGKTGGA